MRLRRGVILGLVMIGGILIQFGVPPPYRFLVRGATALVLAYVYAQLTKPKGLL